MRRAARCALDHTQRGVMRIRPLTARRDALLTTADLSGQNPRLETSAGRSIREDERGLAGGSDRHVLARLGHLDRQAEDFGRDDPHGLGLRAAADQ